MTAKGKILVVDDDRLVLATLAHGLSQAGYEVIDADNDVDDTDFDTTPSDDPDPSFWALNGTLSLVGGNVDAVGEVDTIAQSMSTSCLLKYTNIQTSVIQWKAVL